MQSVGNSSSAGLEKVLTERKLWKRRVQRGIFANSVKPRPPLIWGGTREQFHVYWGISVFVTILSLFVAAALFNLHGKQLPGGAFNLLIVVAATIAWPLYGYVARKREIGRRGRTADEVFASEACRLLPSVSKEFALAARSALAAAYCIPVDLIGILDTRKRSILLSLVSGPLAVEVIAQIDRTESTTFDYRNLDLGSEAFRAQNASNVAELIGILYREMRGGNQTK